MKHFNPTLRKLMVLSAFICFAALPASNIHKALSNDPGAISEAFSEIPPLRKSGGAKIPARGNHNSVTYKADLTEGTIGSADSAQEDKAYDNIFHIALPEETKPDQRYYLCYELFGVKNHLSVTRSINDEQVTGGQFVQIADEWSRQQEVISPAVLHKGDNVVRFSKNPEGHYSYRIRNVSILSEGRQPRHPRIVVNEPAGVYMDSLGYVKGIVEGIDETLLKQSQLFLDNTIVPVFGNEFELVFPKPGIHKNVFEASLKMVLPGGRVITKPLVLKRQTGGYATFAHGEKGISKTNIYRSRAGLDLTLESNTRRLRLQIPGDAMPEHSQVSVTALREVDLPPLNIDMVNVTGGAAAYRFLPHKSKFTRPANLYIPFDSTLIPEGYTTADIHTYFFDEITRSWEMLAADSALEDQGVVRAITDHFTDMINGIIQVPESPQTQGYTPTSIKDLKAADPASNITLIHPPVASSSGAALMEFPFKIPAGRKNLQPQLALQYHNQGGNSWVGCGWNLSIPSVEIDTRWGAPAFDRALETESYTVDGQPLAPVVHQNKLVSRTSGKKFTLRVEGSFQQIIRHGNTPDQYWWEVTSKEGLSQYYGGTPGSGVNENAVLRNKNRDIGHWALYETRDPNGNFVRYHYTIIKEADGANGTNGRQQQYIESITYTGYGNEPGPYRITFIRDRELNHTRRKDIQVSGLLGFKQITADLLSRVNIFFRDQPIRSYTLEYKPGAFLKSLLTAVSELDATGETFYTHRFEYYDDVQAQSGYKPYTGEKDQSPGNDDVRGDLINPIDVFSSKGSALSSSKSNNFNAGLALTIGPAVGGLWDKTLSAGGSFNYGEDNAEGMVSLVDINGDALPDKVFKKNDQLYYRKNTGITAPSFGEARPITGITDFSKTHSQTTTSGFQIVAYLASFAYSNSTTTSTTTQYFSDFNADGLVDIVSNGTVFFNRINSNGDPEFIPTSAGTPNPITYENTVDQTLLSRDDNLQAQQERQFPLHDVVRFWQAPFDGVVSVESEASLVKTETPSGSTNTHKDGVLLSIEHNGTQLAREKIEADDFLPKRLEKTTLRVLKNQRIYFRVQSIYNGVDDVVDWQPVVQYSSVVPAETDANNKKMGRYSAKEDFILDSRDATLLLKKGEIDITGLFEKPVTSDSVTVLITRKHANTTSELYRHTFSPDANVSIPIKIQRQAVDSADQLRFIISSPTFIDRSAIDWQPSYTYTSFADGTAAVNSLGHPILSAKTVPDNTNFNDVLIPTPAIITNVRDTVLVRPEIVFNGSPSGNLVFSVKGINQLVSQHSLIISNGRITNWPQDIPVQRAPGKPLFFEFTTANRALALSVRKTGAVLTGDSTYYDSKTRSYKTTRKEYPAGAGLYTNPEQIFMGPLFRGWGQFALKGSTSNVPIDESKLNLDELKNYPDDPDLYTDSGNVKILDPTQVHFIVLYANGSNRTWSGLDPAVYVSAAKMSSSRLWKHDVFVAPLMEGRAVTAVNKINLTESESFTGGISYAGVGISGGTTNASTTSQMDMADMNGDGYPDIVTAHAIQYTLPNGELRSQATGHNAGATEHNGYSAGATLGSGFPVAFTSMKTSESASNAQKQAATSISLSGNIAEGGNTAVSSWMDINADGLPDKIYENGNVQLNLGYSFDQGESWDFENIGNNQDQSIGGGAGISTAFASFQAGFGLSRTESKTLSCLQDMNGDGLPDKIKKTSSGFEVSFNTGYGFDSPIQWNGVEIATNVSTGESLNAAFTVVIPIIPPFVILKLCINPSFNIGHGVSRSQYQIADLNGDAYPDLLYSDNDGHLVASFSTIGRTNMLRKVQRPLHSYFLIDYQRQGNTYDLPQSKWVMKSVDLFDGLAGDGADTTRSNFHYTNGKYDRRERVFLGFGEVITEELNTLDNNAVARKRIRKYLTDSYYNKGLLAAEWLEDGAGKKYTETRNHYQPATVKTFSEFPALVQTDSYFYEGQSIAGASTSIQYRYDELGNIIYIEDKGDGSDNDRKTARIRYHSLNRPYLQSIPAEIVVSTVEGIKRRRTSEIDSKGNTTRIRQYLGDGSYAATDMNYDGYGNLSKITRPENYRQQRMWYAYEYDQEVNSFVTKITDAFGYSSTTDYNYLYGTVHHSKSMNDEEMFYEYDSAGRLIRFTGPYEIKSGKPYTIAHEYYPGAEVPYAVTRNYDPEFETDIPTITFADGLGRTVQVKKQTALFKGSGEADELSMIVSGKRIFDALGREIAIHYPVVENLGPLNIQYAGAAGASASASIYDVQDRTTLTTLTDGATTKISYSAASQRLIVRTEDPLGNVNETLTDLNDRKTETRAYGGPEGLITTHFLYNALDELVTVTDTKGNTTTYTYDNLGRKTSLSYPDAGLTEYKYDHAGNLLEKITAQIRYEIPEGGAIRYGYDYERLTDIDYPRNYQHKVTYTYGAPGKGARTGRLILTQDASGGEELFYGPLGEITKTIRTVMLSPIYTVTYVSEQEYDTWNRIKKMVYADGEEVVYRYNKGGKLKSFSGLKLGNAYSYIKQIGYDAYEQRVFVAYGNQTTATYEYEPIRRRLSNLRVVLPDSTTIMNNLYSYDAASNILSIENNVKADSTRMGGYVKHQYVYDNFYRLVNAKGAYQGGKTSAHYNLDMAYDNLYNVVSKQLRDSASEKNYNYQYTYDTKAPHQIKSINGQPYAYDLNGNHVSAPGKEHFWDEENRLMGVLNDKLLSQYTYDADGERVVKSSGGLQGIWVNGAPAGAVKHKDNYTIYVSPYIVCRKALFTKHYYIENERVTSKIGNGHFSNISFPGSALTAGGIDYTKRAEAIEKNRQAYYASLGVSPGPPTDKNFWAKPENSGITAPVFTDATASSVPPGWPHNPDPPRVGQPIYIPNIPSNDSVRAGYGFKGTGHEYEKLQYFYHPDHLGSTSYGTDALGGINQHVEYSGFGETFFEEHTGSTTMPYFFNAKERDTETGYYYYGARYYDAKTSVWMSVDPMMEHLPGISPYNFNLGNPVKMIDVDGNAPTMAEAARISAHVYGDKKDDVLINGWKQAVFLPLNFNNKLTGFKSAAYQREGTGEYVYATAGTDGLFDQDMVNNILQIYGLSPQYAQSVKNAKLLSAYIGSGELTFVGHSLGGGLATHNALRTGRNAVVFNPSGVSFLTNRKIFGKTDKIQVHVELTDPLNAVQNCTWLPNSVGEKNYYVPNSLKSLFNGHTIANFYEK